VLSATWRSEALELWSNEEGDRAISLDTALKFSALASYAPNDPILYPDRWSETGLFRLRLGLTANVEDWMTAQFAYEHRAQASSGRGGFGAAGGALPSFAKAPYRLGQLDWSIYSEDDFFYRHEIDRALVALHPSWGEVTVGRQAIGLGRGVVFSAVDLFSPFNPIEVDREWRRGVDAVRLEYHTSDTSSVELLGVFGESWDDSAVIGRARGYIGEIDGELLIGKRARDAFVGVTMSRVVGDAEVHGELALFHTPDAFPDGGLFSNDHLVAKAVLGTSYTFDIGSGLTLFAEYHYSGFGVKEAADVTQVFRDPDVQERFLRGDTQILGQHALGTQMTYAFATNWNGFLLTLVSPTDASGLISPSIGWNFSEYGSVRVSTFLPWGSSPHNGRLGSEYGSTGKSLFVQVSLYF
jgi:hypothetical protein